MSAPRKGKMPNCAARRPVLEPLPNSNPPCGKTAKSRRDEASFMQLEETPMAWTTPTIVEVCVGMEITAYSSAEI